MTARTLEVKGCLKPQTIDARIGRSRRVALLIRLQLRLCRRKVREGPRLSAAPIFLCGPPPLTLLTANRSCNTLAADKRGIDHSAVMYIRSALIRSYR
jgi:hypothetical protein